MGEGEEREQRRHAEPRGRNDRMRQGNYRRGRSIDCWKWGRSAWSGGETDIGHLRAGYHTVEGKMGKGEICVKQGAYLISVNGGRGQRASERCRGPGACLAEEAKRAGASRRRGARKAS